MNKNSLFLEIGSPIEKEKIFLGLIKTKAATFDLKTLNSKGETEVVTPGSLVGTVSKIFYKTTDMHNLIVFNNFFWLYDLSFGRKFYLKDLWIYDVARFKIADTLSGREFLLSCGRFIAAIEDIEIKL